MYSLQYKAVFNDGNVYDFNQLVDFTMATYAKTKPNIDGIESEGEWPLNTAMRADSDEYVKQIKNWGGADDLSADVRLMWDEENLYMISNVKDNVQRNVAEGLNRNAVYDVHVFHADKQPQNYEQSDYNAPKVCADK